MRLEGRFPGRFWDLAPAGEPPPRLFHHFPAKHAPEVHPSQPALVAGGLDPAPSVQVGARHKVADDPGFEGGDGVTAGVALAPDGAGGAGDDKSAQPGKHALMDPALGSLPVPDFTPGAVFGDDFHRQFPPQVDPVDRILHAGSGAQVDLVGAQADEPG